MLTQGLIELILYVEDMAQQVAFYRDILELPILYPAEQTDYSNEVWVVLATGSCKLALHGGGKRRLGEDTPRLVFGVADIHVAHATLLAHGVQLGAIFSAAPGIWVSHGSDPEGNPIAIEMHES